MNKEMNKETILSRANIDVYAVTHLHYYCYRRSGVLFIYSFLIDYLPGGTAAVMKML
ncbi:Uncharacterised protein [Raoultella terrigena]|uniref:Uncharacterized protein n=1 Tax=Raoultella terrigena TaxID=577 RepID=A0A4U9CY28_RAOTE|nr:Uncharacterised protein [Raoultella terrigena]